MTPKRRVNLGRVTREMVPLPGIAGNGAVAEAVTFDSINVKRLMATNQSNEPAPIHSAQQHSNKLAPLVRGALSQEPKPAGASSKADTKPATEPTHAARFPAAGATRPALLTAAQAAREVYGISERTFHDMRAKGLVPAAVELGPRLLRWHRSELEAAIGAFPRRAEALPAPAQLLRGKIDRMKAGASAAPAK